jgi:hypothetical protein
MRAALLPILFAAGVAAFTPPAAAQDKPVFPKFKTQEIDTGLSIGYAVIVTDIDGDKKPDIVVVDKHKVVWYQNPTWKKRVILDGKTKPDNVCVADIDLDGDGLPELVVGAGWKPFDTETAGQLCWLKRGKSLDDEWAMNVMPCDEPMVHRVRVADLDGDGRKEIIMAPLMGRGATQKGNWMDGRPVRILRYVVPENEKLLGWRVRVVNEDLHVVHNIFTATIDKVVGVKPYDYIYAASYEGVTNITPGKVPGRRHLGVGDQSNPAGSRGASELFSGRGALATIEPWHGNKVVTYRSHEADKPLERRVIDDRLRWGHAVKMVNLDDDVFDERWDEIVVGVRDNPNPKAGDTHTEKCGVRIYKNVAADKLRDNKWERFLLDEGGVAVEDLAVADLDGDGKPDIVAVGRATKNCRIYWNQGK